MEEYQKLFNKIKEMLNNHDMLELKVSKVQDQLLDLQERFRRKLSSIKRDEEEQPSEPKPLNSPFSPFG
jgi:hypothetical protein